MLITLIVFALLGQNSPFNTYSSHLNHVKWAGGCAIDDINGFRNRTYRFRDALMYPFDEPLVLRNGRSVERNADGSIEWETSLEVPQIIALAKARAVLLDIGATHLGGTGSIDYLLVARCSPKEMEVVFEARGPISNVTYSAAHGLRITHDWWSRDDCHACPSREVIERFTWDDVSDRFVFAGRSERRLAQRH